MAEPLARIILARNLRHLIDAERASVRGWAMKRGLDPRTIDRLVNMTHSVSIDKLEEVAHAIGVEPWQLLIPDFADLKREVYGLLRELLGPA